jgi:hypothetical protein
LDKQQTPPSHSVFDELRVRAARAEAERVRALAEQQEQQAKQKKYQRDAKAARARLIPLFDEMARSLGEVASGIVVDVNDQRVALMPYVASDNLIALQYVSPVDDKGQRRKPHILFVCSPDGKAGLYWTSGLPVGPKPMQKPPQYNRLRQWPLEELTLEVAAPALDEVMRLAEGLPSPPPAATP